MHCCSSSVFSLSGVCCVFKVDSPVVLPFLVCCGVVFVCAIAENQIMLSRLLSRRSAVRAMSGVAVKVYVPTPEEQRLPAAALKTQFFNLGIEHVSLAQLQGKNSKAKNVQLAALAEAGELIQEKLAYYKPTVHPTQNQSTMTVKQVKSLLSTPGATEISEADKAKTLAAIASMSDSQTVVVENTKFGQPLVEHFVEELGLHLSRAAIASGNADPLQFMKSLYTKGMWADVNIVCMHASAFYFSVCMRDLRSPTHLHMNAVCCFCSNFVRAQKWGDAFAYMCCLCVLIVQIFCVWIS